MPSPIVLTPQLILVTPATGIKTGKEPSKSFKFDLVPGLDKELLRELELKGVSVKMRIFAYATLKTKTGRAGLVSMQISLDNKKIASKSHQFDPTDWPPGQGITVDEEVLVPKLKGLRSNHVISADTKSHTDRNTYWRIYVQILEVSEG